MRIRNRLKVTGKTKLITKKRNMATVAEAKRKNWTESVFRAHCSMRFKKKPNQTPGIPPRTANSTTKVETWRKILKKLSWKWEKVPRRCCEEDWCASPTVQKVRPTCVLLFRGSSEVLLVFFRGSSRVLPVFFLCASCVRPVFFLCSFIPLYHCTNVPMYHCTTVPLLTVPPPPPPPLNYSCTTLVLLPLLCVVFHSIRRQLVKCIAVNSACGYLLGMGDRHLENFLISNVDGNMAAIDFGMSFGMATFILPVRCSSAVFYLCGCLVLKNCGSWRVLLKGCCWPVVLLFCCLISGLGGCNITPWQVPELIPFRLTTQMLNIMNPLNTTVLLRNDMCNIMQALRTNKKTLLAITDVFVHDPLVEWYVVNGKDVYVFKMVVQDVCLIVCWLILIVSILSAFQVQQSSERQTNESGQPNFWRNERCIAQSIQFEQQQQKNRRRQFAIQPWRSHQHFENEIEWGTSIGGHSWRIEQVRLLLLLFAWCDPLLTFCMCPLLIVLSVHPVVVAMK